MAFAYDDLPPHLRPRKRDPVPVYEELPLDPPPPQPTAELKPEVENPPDPYLRRSQ